MVNNFDPDAFLTGTNTPSSSGFDPDAFLSGSQSQPELSLFEKIGQLSKLTPWNIASQGVKTLAENTAERMGRGGIPPKVAATAMLPLAIAPALVGAAGSFEGLVENPDTITKAITHAPSDLSPEYDALYKEAGISKNLPETGGRTARFPNLAGQPSKVPPPFAPAIAPNNYPRDPNSLMNFARARMEGLGDRLSPQELSDYKTLIGQLIDTGKVGGGQPLATAAQLRSKASSLLNNRVEGLDELNKVYALSSKFRDPMQFLPTAVQGLVKKYGPWVGVAAASKLGWSVLPGHQ